MKFCFGFGALATLTYHKIAEEIIRRFPETSFSGYVIGRQWYRYLRSTGFPYTRLEVLTDYIAEHWKDFKPDLDYLKAMEREYGIPNLWLYVTADRFICRHPYENILKMIEGHFRFFTRFLGENRPDVIVAGSPAGMSSYIFYSIAQRMGITYLGFGIGPVPGTIRFMHPDGKVRGLQEKYNQYLKRPLSFEERNRAEAFLDEFRGNSLKLRYTGHAYGHFLQPARLWFNPLVLVRHIIDQYIVERGRDFSVPTVGEMVMGKLARVTRRVLVQLTRVFDLPREGEPFVLFPLQIDPEATTLVHGPFYIDQAALAENIARSLPMGYKLYVKEHPMLSVGHKPLSVYRRLRKIPNARLIAPEIDSHELIRCSSAVVVIYSTVGWEAILYEKPLVVLGNIFLKDFEGAYFVRALTDLPGVLCQALTTFRPDRERLLRYILAVLDCAYLGNILPLHNEPDSDDIRSLASAVALEAGLVSS